MQGKNLENAKLNNRNAGIVRHTQPIGN